MTTGIRLIIGLGNPGPEYAATRHNVGFWLADHVAHDFTAQFSVEKTFFSSVAKARVKGEAVIIAKPATFMNRSGQAAGALMHFYKLSPEQVLVLHDELDLLPGDAKLKQGGGHAGHNGLRDIQSQLGNPAFWRLRIGIGHPRTLGLNQQVAGFVLSPPRREDMPKIESALDRCRAVVPALIDGQFEQAMSQLHSANGG
jgi:PTH1 family peptidyl-tRNA hydrolase